MNRQSKISVVNRKLLIPTAIVLVIALPCLLSSWPWIDKKGTIALVTGFGGTRISEKFSDGQKYMLHGKPKGERVPYFDDSPDNKLKIYKVLARLDFIPIDNLQLQYSTSFNFASHETAQRQGFGDSWVSVKYKLPIKVALAVFAGSVIPTGIKSQFDTEISLGDGFWTPFVGLTTGTRAFQRLFIYTSQQFNFPSTRKLTSAAFEGFGNDHERRGAGWQGAVSAIYGFSFVGTGLSAEWLLENKTTGEFTGAPVDDREGHAHFSIRTMLDQKIGKFKIFETVVLPITGKNWPSQPQFEVLLAYKFQLYNRR